MNRIPKMIFVVVVTLVLTGISVARGESAQQAKQKRAILEFIGESSSAFGVQLDAWGDSSKRLDQIELIPCNGRIAKAPVSPDGAESTQVCFNVLHATYFPPSGGRKSGHLECRAAIHHPPLSGLANLSELGRASRDGFTGYKRYDEWRIEANCSLAEPGTLWNSRTPLGSASPHKSERLDRDYRNAETWYTRVGGGGGDGSSAAEGR